VSVYVLINLIWAHEKNYIKIFMVKNKFDTNDLKINFTNVNPNLITTFEKLYEGKF